MITNPNSPTAITPALLATMDAGLANLRTGCAALPTADAALLRRAAKMGLKSETFSREAIELAKQNTHLCPAGIDLEQAERTMAVRDALLSRYLQARQLAEALEVAMQVCGVDVFDTARTAYKSMKANCRDAALLELLDYLGRNFRSRRAEKQSDPDLEPSTGSAEFVATTEPVASAAHDATPERETTPYAVARFSNSRGGILPMHRQAGCEGQPAAPSLQPRDAARTRRPQIYWFGAQTRDRNCAPVLLRNGQLRPESARACNTCAPGYGARS